MASRGRPCCFANSLAFKALSAACALAAATKCNIFQTCLDKEHWAHKRVSKVRMEDGNTSLTIQAVLVEQPSDEQDCCTRCENCLTVGNDERQPFR